MNSSIFRRYRVKLPVHLPRERFSKVECKQSNPSVLKRGRGRRIGAHFREENRYRSERVPEQRTGGHRKREACYLNRVSSAVKRASNSCLFYFFFFLFVTYQQLSRISSSNTFLFTPLLADARKIRSGKTFRADSVIRSQRREECVSSLPRLLETDYRWKWLLMIDYRILKRPRGCVYGDSIDSGVKTHFRAS